MPNQGRLRLRKELGMKTLVNPAWRLVIIVTIVALVLMGCVADDGYPEWYNDSIFMPLYDNPYDQMRAPTYQISNISPATVEITYSLDITENLIKRLLAIEIVMIGYRINGDQEPTEIKSEVVTSIRMPSELSDGDGSYLPLQRTANVESWLSEKHGAVLWKLKYHHIGSGASYFCEYLQIFYAKNGDEAHVFKTYDEFYKYQKNAGGI